MCRSVPVALHSTAEFVRCTGRCITLQPLLPALAPFDVLVWMWKLCPIMLIALDFSDAFLSAIITAIASMAVLWHAARSYPFGRSGALHPLLLWSLCTVLSFQAYLLSVATVTAVNIPGRIRAAFPTAEVVGGLFVVVATGYMLAQLWIVLRGEHHTQYKARLTHAPRKRLLRRTTLTAAVWLGEYANQRFHRKRGGGVTPAAGVRRSRVDRALSNPPSPAHPAPSYVLEN